MKTRRINYNVDENRDRLSDLPDCILIHIISTLNAKQAVQTCILKTRWKNLWKLLPVLSLDCVYFNSLTSFNKLVSRILSLRDDKTALHALKFYSKGHTNHHLLKRVTKYAFSHNVKILEMTMGCCRKCLPLFYFSCHTLTSLTITSGTGPFREFQNSLNFPSLTNLCLRFFAFHSSDDKGYVDPFSSFKCLNTLIIDRCSVDDEDNLSISSVTLVNLTIKTYGSYKFELSTPNLCSFDFTGNPVQKLNNSNNNFSSIKHVHIDVHIGLFDEKYPLILLNWLTQLGVIETLTVSSKTLEILDLVPDLWIIDFPCLRNLKLLRIKMYKHLPIPHGVDDFLLQNAPSAEKSVIDLS